MKFDYFSLEQVKDVHEASLDILKRVGISTQLPKLRDILLSHGCQEKNGRILFTQDVIDQGMKTVPECFQLHGRRGDYVLDIGKKRAYCQTLVGAPSVIDLESGKRRDAVLKDLQDITRLADALDYVNIISPLFPRDVPQEIILTMETATLFRSSSKPFSICIESSREMPYIIDILTAVAGSPEALREKPVATLPVSPVSPLEYGVGPAEAMLDIVDAGIPLGVEPSPTMGATGPMTVVGCTAMHNAEMLAGIVACQLYKPGCPLSISSRTGFMDMRTGLSLWAAPEFGLAAAASNQLANYYRIPNAPGGYSGSSQIADAQSAMEHTYNALMEGLVGSDIIGSAGSLDNALIKCYVMLVIDNEISSLVQRTINPPVVNEDVLAVQVVQDVIEKQSNFLEQKHTRKHLRAGELWVPTINQRQTFEQWEVKGEKLEDVAKQKAQELLASHEVMPLSTEVDKEIEGIIAQAKKDLM